MHSDKLNILNAGKQPNKHLEILIDTVNLY